MSENGEIYSAGKNFTLPPALTAWTNSTSETEKYATYKYENVEIYSAGKNFTLPPAVSHWQ